MNTYFHRIMSISVCMFLSICFINAEEVTRTRKIQVAIRPANDPAFTFIQNTGNGLSTAFFPRAFGSYYYLSSSIFPSGTFSKSQTSFVNDRHGRNPNNRAIGTWYCVGNVIADETFPLNVPTGTRGELIRWDFYFDRSCSGTNSIFSLGESLAGDEVVAFRISAGVVGGTGCNLKAEPNSLSANIFFAQDGTALINIKFEEPIIFRD